MNVFFGLASFLIGFAVVARRFEENDECLRQSDFDDGTVIISEPGMYKLCEDIVFRPNFPQSLTDQDFETIFDPDLTIYSANAYGLGFFAAIAIQASGVTLDLNGYTLEQSPEHALIQRFFALIELGSAPFIRNAGPAQFVGDEESFASATDLVIRGPGTLGRSSHHGIHGNENRNVKIKDVTFRDFEVAAVSLNNVDDLHIEYCKILHNREDVPIVGSFSAARFIRPYMKHLADIDYSLPLRGQTVRAIDLYGKLLKSIKNVFIDVVEKGFIDSTSHPEEFHLFDNHKRVVDGPCYALLVHGIGPAVGDFGNSLSNDDSQISSNIVIEHNLIENITCWNNEVPTALEDGKPVNDARGAVLQFVKTFDSGSSSALAINEDGTYKGNVVADSQIMVANAILEGILKDTPELQTKPNSINQNIIDWAMGTDESKKIYTPLYRCNGDSMHHVIKGVCVIRVDNVAGFNINHNEIKNVTNLSEKPFSECTDYHFTNPENSGEQQLGNLRMISVAAVAGFRDEEEEKPPKDKCNFKEPKSSKCNNMEHKNDKGDHNKERLLNPKTKEARHDLIHSILQSNRVFDAHVANPKKIIGIDVQGISSDVDIIENVVDLGTDVTATPGGDVVVLGLRLRSNVINCAERDNVFAQGFTKEEAPTLRRMVKSLPNGHPVIIEWNYGDAPGCPFSRGL